MNLFTAHGLLAPSSSQTGDDASSGFNKESIHAPCDSLHKTQFGGLLLLFVKSRRLITSKPALL